MPTRQAPATPLGLTIESTAPLQSIGYWLMPALFAATLQLAFLGRRANLDGHEVLVAQTAREMLATGDWVLPRLAGEPRLRKPPLAYWLTAAAYRITGRSDEFAARLPSALAALATVGLLAWGAGRWFGPRIGCLTGLFHATTYWTLAYGKCAQIDSTLALLTAGAILSAAYDRLIDDPPQPALAIFGFWILLGLAVLAKGPVALGVVLPTAVAYRLLRRSRPGDRPFFRQWATLAGLLFAFLPLALAWPAAIAWSHPEVISLWNEQSVGRFLAHWGPDTRPWFYYLYEVPRLTLPWSPIWITGLLGATWVAARRPGSWDRPDDRRLLLWLWAFVAVVFFSLSAGKRAHYILPGLAPFSLLAALHFDRFATTLAPLLRRLDRFPRRMYWLIVVGAAAASLVPAIASGSEHLLIGAPALILALGASGAALVDWLRNRRSRRAACSCFAFLALTVLVVETHLAPAFHWRSQALALFARNRAAFDAAERVVQYGSNDHWSIFPIDRPMRWPRNLDSLRATLAEAPRSLVLVPSHRLEELIDAVPGTVIDRVGDEPSLAESDPRLKLALVRPHCFDSTAPNRAAAEGRSTP